VAHTAKELVMVTEKLMAERVAVSSHDVGALVLRVAVGAVLAVHGTQHLFGWFDGPSLDGYTRLVESLGYEPARLLAVVGGISEVAGGLLLILGLLTPLGVAAAVGVTGNAVISFHPAQEDGFWLSFGDFPLLLGLSAVAVAFVGPGLLSLDRSRSWVRGEPRWALSGVGLGVGVAVVALVLKFV
jgi:putative oxidoreductase